MNEDYLDASRLVQPITFHVHDLPCIPVNAPRVLSICMLGLQTVTLKSAKAEKKAHPKLRKHSHRIASRVLHQGSWDDFHGVCYGSERPPFDTFDLSGSCTQTHTDCHLCCAATGCECRIEYDIASDRHSISEIAVNLVQDVLGWPAKEDCAGFWVIAFSEEGEIS